MSEIRDLAPLMTSRDLLERLLATVDEVVNDEPARGSIRGCAITLAARLEQTEKALAEIQGVCQRRRTSLHMDGSEMFSNPAFSRINIIARAALAPPVQGDTA